MNGKKLYDVVIIGIGEIGRPLYELLNGVYKVLPVDPVHFKENIEVDARCEFLHICIPGELSNFDDIVLEYINKYIPLIVFIHSTLVPGTTDKLNSKTGAIIVHSPVHGKHHNNQMKKDMLRYPKYIGSSAVLCEKTIDKISNHLKGTGFADVRFLSNACSTEWLKVLSTTYFGLVISWAQEVERVCNAFDLKYDEITDFFGVQEDVGKIIYSGFIGGHCVMQNVEIIKGIYDSKLLDWMCWSNEEKRNLETQ